MVFFCSRRASAMQSSNLKTLKVKCYVAIHSTSSKSISKKGGMGNSTQRLIRADKNLSDIQS